MAELFVGAVVPILLEKLASVGVSQFLKLVKGNTLDPKTIRKWEKNLKMIGALLSDAEQRQNESNAVKLWLEDLQDLAYDLEDILDDFATEAELYQLQKTQKDDDDANSTKIRASRFLESAKHKVCILAMWHVSYKLTCNKIYIAQLPCQPTFNHASSVHIIIIVPFKC